MGHVKVYDGNGPDAMYLWSKPSNIERLNRADAVKDAERLKKDIEEANGL